MLAALTPLESCESVAFMFFFVAAKGNSDEQLPYFYAVMGFVVCTLMAMAFTLRQLYYSVS